MSSSYNVSQNSCKVRVQQKTKFAFETSVHNSQIFTTVWKIRSTKMGRQDIPIMQQTTKNIPTGKKEGLYSDIKEY